MPAAAKAGSDAGNRLGENMSSGARERLREARGRFVSEGQKLGEGVGEGVSKGIADGFGREAGRIALDLASAIGVRKFTQGLREAVDLASDLNEQTVQLEVVFGKYAGHVERFAKDAFNIGQSERFAKSAANTFGSLFRQFEIGEEKAASMSLNLLQRAADIASMRNAPIEDVFAAMRSGLVGEIEPLRRYGVALSDVELRQEAVALGLENTAGTILPASTRAQAAYELILKKSAIAAGDYARTSNQLANTERKNAAIKENEAANLGQNFLPVYKEISNVTAKLATAFGTLPGPVQFSTVALVGLGVALPLMQRLYNGAKALRTSFLEAAAGGSRLASVGAGLTKTAGILGVVVGAASLLDSALQNVGRRALDVERIARAAELFAKSGLFDAGLAEVLDGNVKNIAVFLHNAQIESPVARTPLIGGFLERFGQFGGGQLDDINEAKNALKALDEALVQLMSEGKTDQAKALFNLLARGAEEGGSSVGALTAALPRYADALADADLEQRAAARSAKTYIDLLNELVAATLTPMKLHLGVDDAVQGAIDALKDLEQTKLDAEGKGERSKRAAEAEADAQRDLKRAYDDAADAARKLDEARNELAEFDAGTSQRIRALEREQIVRRRVTTESDVRQKELDLLKHDERVAEERQNLQDAVADAERGVADAADRVGEAQRRVAEAAEERKRIQVEAAAAIESAERKAEVAILNAGDALATFAEKAQPGDAVLQGYVDKLLVLAQLLDPSGELAKGLREFVENAPKATRTSAPGRPKGKPDNPPPPAKPPSTTPTGTTTTTLPSRGLGGIIDAPLGQPQLIIAHGQERVLTPAERAEWERRDRAPAQPIVVNNENHFHGRDHPVRADVEYAARELGWMISNLGKEA